jgi:hypothetical protein
MLLLYGPASTGEIVAFTFGMAVIVCGCIIGCYKFRRLGNDIERIRRAANQIPGVELGNIAQVIGGANSLLNAIAEPLKNVNKTRLTKTLMTNFEFLLDLPYEDYETIVYLFINIEENNNFEQLIIIVARGLGFEYVENIENVESTTSMFNKEHRTVLGNDAESRINAILQKCSQGSVLKLTKNKVDVVENVMTILSKALIDYFKKPNEKKLLKSLPALDILKQSFLKK